MTGVYGIFNTANGKVYVGSAAKSLAKRFTSHRYKLNKGVHHNRHLQAAWNKYGKGSFEFVILDECPPERCLEQEQSWIDSFDSCDPRFGYNECPVAGSPLGYKHSEETRKKVSAALKGKKKSVEHSVNIRLGKRFTSEETKIKMRQSAGLREAQPKEVNRRRNH